MNHRRPRTLLALTLLTIATAILTTAAGPRPGSITIPPPFTAPVLALEFVQSPQQFTGITQQPAARTLSGPPVWASTLFWRATLADLTFIAAYGFLWLWLLACAGGRRRRAVIA